MSRHDPRQDLPTSPLVRGVHHSPMPLIEKVFSSLARRLQTGLLQRIFEDVPVQVHDVRTTTFASALSVLNEPKVRRDSAPEPVQLVRGERPSHDRTVYAVLRCTPSGLPGFIAFDTDLMRALVQRMLGQEDPIFGEDDAPLTEIELRIANRVFAMIVEGIAAEWQDNGPQDLVVQRATNGPRYIDDRDMGSASVVGAFFFGDGDPPIGRVAICLPTVLVDRMIDQHAKAGAAVPDSGARAKNMERLQNLEVELVARCPVRKMSLRQLRELAVGETLMLGQSARCVVSANGHPVAAAELGEASGARAVRITERLG